MLIYGILGRLLGAEFLVVLSLVVHIYLRERIYDIYAMLNNVLLPLTLKVFVYQRLDAAPLASCL